MRHFSPAKLVWTERDFDQMSWHDCRLHGVGFIDDFDPHLHELRLDIDYILKWCDRTGPDDESGFWISPATLVFDAFEDHVEVPGLIGTWIIAIDRVARNGQDTSRWTIRLNTGGMIGVSAAGFRQYIRQPPTFVRTPWQYLETRQRGPICFDVLPYDP